MIRGIGVADAETRSETVSLPYVFVAMCIAFGAEAAIGAVRDRKIDPRLQPRDPVALLAIGVAALRQGGVPTVTRAGLAVGSRLGVTASPYSISMICRLGERRWQRARLSSAGSSFFLRPVARALDEWRGLVEASEGRSADRAIALVSRKSFPSSHYRRISLLSRFAA